MWVSKPQWFTSTNVDDYAVVYNRRSFETHILNFLADTVLTLIAMGNSGEIASLKQAVAEKLAMPVADIPEKAIQATLDQLDAAGLIIASSRYQDDSPLFTPICENIGPFQTKKAGTVDPNGSFLHDLSDWELWQRLKHGRLTIKLGPFIWSLKAPYKGLIAHLRQQYAPCQLLPSGTAADISLELTSPSWLRRYLKPQVMPLHPSFPSLVPLPAAQASLSFEMGLNLHVALGMMRSLILHAGAVATASGQGILMPAASGRGKSTLTASLMQAGARLLSDEFGLVTVDKGAECPDLLAFPRPISLKNESIAIVRDLAGDQEVSPTLKGTPKGDVAYRRARASDINGADQPAKPALILFPHYKADTKGVVATPLSASDCLTRLIQGATNYQMMGYAGYQALLALVQSTPAYDIHYNDCAAVIDFIRNQGLDFAERGEHD